MIKKRYLILLLLFPLNLWAQNDSTSMKLVVKGIGTDTNGVPLPNLMVINQTTMVGNFGDGNGQYQITIHPTDNIKFGAYGFESLTVNFSDSIYSDTIIFNPQLAELSFTLAEATIISPRELNEIQREIETLGYNEKDYRISGLDAARSPITFLYQQFSKYEKQKRLAKELENADRKRELLKELLARYAYFEIVALNKDEFDQFIDFLNVTDDFLKNSTQYEFIVFVKNRYLQYKSFQPPERRLKYDDYDYDKD